MQSRHSGGHRSLRVCSDRRTGLAPALALLMLGHALKRIHNYLELGAEHTGDIKSNMIYFH